MFRTYFYLLNTTVSEKTVEISEEKLSNLIRSYVNQIEVNELWYVSMYKDVAEAIAAGAIKSAREHYVLFGYFENRMPRPIKIDEEWYLKQYSDVKKDAQAHFINFGFKEGRVPYEGWSIYKD